MGKALEVANIVSSVATAVVAALALSFSVWQFNEGQKLAQENLDSEREAKAVELFIKFNEMKEEMESKSTAGPAGVDFWRENSLLGITESLYNLTQGNDKWESTIDWMLGMQKDFLQERGVNCNTYSSEFIEFLKSGGPVKCS